MTQPRRSQGCLLWPLLLLVCLLPKGPVLGVVAATTHRQLLQSRSPAPAPGPKPLIASNSSVPLPIKTGGITYPFMPALFAFGDSFVDTGNVPLLAKIGLPPPYGQSPHGVYTIGGRFSNGMILPDYLSQILGLSPLSHPILEPNASWYYGCSFGFSGSGALRAGNNPGPLPDQTIAFREFVGNATLYWRDNSTFPPSLSVLPTYPEPKAFTDGLYLISTGVNDLNIIRDDLSVADAVFANVTASLRSTIQTIYSLGGRNFIVANVVNFGCVPASLHTNGGACNAQKQSLSAQIGEAYRVLLTELQGSLQNTTFLTLDLWNMTTIAPSNPNPLGFPKPTTSCCGYGTSDNVDVVCGSPGTSLCDDPGNYMYWDNIHLTTDFASELAKELFAGSTFIRPKNIMQAFVLPKLQANLAS